MDSSLPEPDDARSYQYELEPIYQLYVGNLPNHLEENQIKRLFKKYNAVSLRLKHQGQRCFAFVRFEDYSSMQFAFRQLNSSSFEGRLLRVCESYKSSNSSASSNQDSKAPSHNPSHLHCEAMEQAQESCGPAEAPGTGFGLICTQCSYTLDSDELNREDFSTLEESVTEKDINMLKYCNLKLKRTKLELEVLKLRLEIQKLQRPANCSTANYSHGPN